MFNKLVFSIAANKSDLFDSEQVKESEARDFANSIGAIFRLTSAFNASGIDDLFNAIGRKFLDPKYSEENPKKPSGNIVIGSEDQKKEKKCC